METKVVLDGGVRQGYPDNNATLLSNDVDKLKKLYRAYKEAPEPDPNNDKVTKLAIGEACQAVYDKAWQRVETVKTALLKIKPDEMVDSELEATMGPLKKVQRIMQKAVHYAVEKGKDTPQLAIVNDVLRATIVLPLPFLRQKEIGGKMIDAVNKAFDGQVVSVKNRFIQTRYPKIMEYYNREMSDSLVQDIVAQVNSGLHGRDTFYRDMQLLIKLPADKFENGKGFSHVVMELQLASKPIYEAKTVKTIGAPSGHDMYKVIRAVTEMCEYLYWTDDGDITPSLPDAASYYEELPASHWENFTKYVVEMWDMYKAAQKLYTPHFDNAIYESSWYKSNENRIRK